MGNNDEDIIKETLVGWKDPMAVLRGISNVQISGFGDLTLDYYNQTMRLSLECHVDEKNIRAHILRKNDEEGITLVIRYGSKLLEVLKAFVASQDMVNEANYKDLVGVLLGTGVELLVETNEGLVPLRENSQ